MSDLTSPEFAQSDQLEHLVDAPLHLGGGTDRVALPEAQAEGNIVEDRQMGKEREALGDKADIALMHRLGGQRLAVEIDFAGVRALEAGDDPQQG